MGAPSSKTRTLTIRLPNEVYDLLLAVAIVDGVPMGTFVRRLICELILRMMPPESE